MVHVHSSLVGLPCKCMMQYTFDCIYSSSSCSIAVVVGIVVSVDYFQLALINKTAIVIQNRGSQCVYFPNVKHWLSKRVVLLYCYNTVLIMIYNVLFPSYNEVCCLVSCYLKHCYTSWPELSKRITLSYRILNVYITTQKLKCSQSGDTTTHYSTATLSHFPLPPNNDSCTNHI